MTTLTLSPAGRRIAAPQGSLLQDVLFEHGVEFPCGGRGRCKGCRVRVLRGQLEPSANDIAAFSAAELAQVLQVSPAAVSGAVRYLTQLNLVHKERVPGSRRDYYRMPDDIWSDLFRLRNQVMQRWAALIGEGIELLGADTRAGARLAEHAMFFEFVSIEMPDVLKRWDEYRAGARAARDIGT